MPRRESELLRGPIAVSSDGWLAFQKGTASLRDVTTAFFRQLLSVAVLVFSVSTMLSVGLGHTVRHVFGPMRDARAVIRALLANFVLVPLVAFGLSKAMRLDSSYETGLMLFATAAGAPFPYPAYAGSRRQCGVERVVDDAPVAAHRALHAARCTSGGA